MGKGGKVNDCTNFQKDIKYGKVGEQIFINDFLEFLNINYEDVTDVQGFRVIDNDFVAKIGMYEIKTSYKDNKIIIIEEYTNINKDFGKESLGWFYKSKADMMVFISKLTRTMILIPFNDKFKAYYESIKKNFELEKNMVSEHNGSMWQSAFRRIPLESLNGYFAYYKKVMR